MLTLQMSGFVLKNSTVKHVSKQKSLVGFVQLTMQITLDRRHVLYSLVLVTVVVIGCATTCRSRRRGGCPHVVLLLWVLAHVQTLSYAGGCVVSSHTQQSFAKLGFCDLARPFATILPCLTRDHSLSYWFVIIFIGYGQLQLKNLNKALVHTVTNLVYCKSRTLFNTIFWPWRVRC